MSTVICTTIQTAAGGPVTLTKQEALKAWSCITVSGAVPTLQTSLNATSITDTATGQVTVTYTTSFSSTNYAVTLGVRETSTSAGRNLYPGRVNTQSTGSILLDSWSFGSSPALCDPLNWYNMQVGTLA